MTDILRGPLEGNGDKESIWHTSPCQLQMRVLLPWEHWSPLSSRQSEVKTRKKVLGNAISNILWLPRTHIRKLSHWLNSTTGNPLQ